MLDLVIFKCRCWRPLSGLAALVMNSISGKSQAEMDTMIENFRKNAKP